MILSKVTSCARFSRKPPSSLKTCLLFCLSKSETFKRFPGKATEVAPPEVLYKKIFSQKVAKGGISGALEFDVLYFRFTFLCVFVFGCDLLCFFFRFLLR